MVITYKKKLDARYVWAPKRSRRFRLEYIVENIEMMEGDSDGEITYH